jgi:hypothetical protein
VFEGDSISILLLANFNNLAQCLESIAGLDKLPIIGKRVYIFLTFYVNFLWLNGLILASLGILLTYKDKALLVSVRVSILIYYQGYLLQVS